MIRSLACAAAALSITAWAAPAAARDIPAGGFTPEDAANWLQNAGYKAKLDKSDADHPELQSAMDGVDFYVTLYDCKSGGRCASLQFHAGFDLKNGMELSKVNEWNHDQRYLRVSLDKENDPFARYDVNLSPGGTYEALDDDFSVWKSSLSAFTDFIGWK